MTSQAAKRATSIRIFLADGTPDGLRIVEKSNWTGRALMISRAQYPEVRSRDEFARPAVYLLRGESQSRGSVSRVYIGEADVARARIDSHLKTKDFWNDLILFTSKDENLNKAHVRYLEARLVGIAREAKQAELDNGTIPQLPVLSEAETADAEAFLEDMLLIYPVLGVSAFARVQSTLAAEAHVQRPLLYLKGKQAQAQGRDTPEGFVVYAGAEARPVAVPSMHAYLEDFREKLKEEGVLAAEGQGVRLAQDYLFNSPSTAAGVLLGRSANGRIEWKDQEGRTLKAIQTAALGPGAPEDAGDSV
jgi:Domain of unknown function (DUF4357)